VFVSARFVSNLIAIYGSHSELAGDKRDRIDIAILPAQTNSASPSAFAPNLLCLKLIKCNQRNWSRFKQTLKKSPLKPSDGCTSRSAIFLKLIYTSHRTLQFRRFYANATRHASSSLLSACSRRRARPNIPSQTTFIRIAIAKFEVEACFFDRFDEIVLQIFPSIKTPCACNYQSILSSVLCQICLRLRLRLSECLFSIFDYSRTGVTALNVFRLHISVVFYPSNKTAKFISIYASI